MSRFWEARDATWRIFGLKIPKPRLVVDYETCACFEIPKFYGISYHDFSRARFIMWWIPLNLIFGFFYRARVWMKQGGWKFHAKQSLTMQIEQLKSDLERERGHRHFRVEEICKILEGKP